MVWVKTTTLRMSTYVTSIKTFNVNFVFHTENERLVESRPTVLRNHLLTQTFLLNIPDLPLGYLDLGMVRTG